MNPLLAKLHPYPFERLRELTSGIVPSADHAPIGLGIGEPRHATPALVEQALVAALSGLASYPATAGAPALRDLGFSGPVLRQTSRTAVQRLRREQRIQQNQKMLKLSRS